mmetsp:Transcript_12070/g.33436  ORF Transcript_12070/g.33436 Transcript_12070/m.33436 type:complete len:220 (-) Transcript_12070:3041-3700(-)
MESMLEVTASNVFINALHLLFLITVNSFEMASHSFLALSSSSPSSFSCSTVFSYCSAAFRFGFSLSSSTCIFWISSFLISSKFCLSFAFARDFTEASSESNTYDFPPMTRPSRGLLTFFVEVGSLTWSITADCRMSSHSVLCCSMLFSLVSIFLDASFRFFETSVNLDFAALVFSSASLCCFWSSANSFSRLMIDSFSTLLFPISSFSFFLSFSSLVVS